MVGVAQPAVMIIFGNPVDEFANAGQFEYCNNASTKTYNKGICALVREHMTTAEKDLMGTMNETYSTDPIMQGTMNNVYWLIGMGLVTWLCGYIQTVTLMVSANR